LPKNKQMKLYSLIRISLLCGLFSLFSCSDDSQDVAETIQTPAENFPVIKKVTQFTDYGGSGSDTSVTDFIYNGSQLISAHTVSGPQTYDSQFHYDGEKVTSVDYFENGVADGFTTLTYNGDLLTSTLSGSDQSEQTIYTYNNGNVATVKSYYPVGPNSQLQQSNTYTYTNGNVTQRLLENYVFSTSTYKNVYTYDSKNNPMRGMNKYLRLTLGNEGFDGLSINNPISWQDINPDTNTVSAEYYYEIIYNDADFPMEIKRFTASSDFLISETHIEYQ